ncbi:hypothetical protein ACFPPD_06695 [Cohnella suwonensis]|uniref:XkdX family protein n=1 Tax=Cohnella suwonensis TaxID=696072 RepID=A0ABW0LTW1_9BACL
MYNFILNQWVMRKIDEAKVQSYVPRWITSEQAATIIATPQVAV